MSRLPRCVQGCDVSANLASIMALTRQAASAGARLVALPEYATYLGPNSALGDVGESVQDGPTVTAVRDLARQLNIAVLLGSLVERSPTGHLYNTSVLIDADGRVARTYRKVHLFSSTLPGATATEADRITAGSELAVVDYDGWRIGMSICYDVRFPELYRELSALGAGVLTVPAAFTSVTGKDHWDVLLRARAIENQAYVIAPAQIGRFEGGESYGRSCVIDPWGTVLAVVGDSEGTGIAIAELDRARLERVRAVLPALTNRRLPRVTLPGSSPAMVPARPHAAGSPPVVAL